MVPTFLVHNEGFFFVFDTVRGDLGTPMQHFSSSNRGIPLNETNQIGIAQAFKQHIIFSPARQVSIIQNAFGE